MEISWTAKGLLASQKGLSSVELINLFIYLHMEQLSRCSVYDTGWTIEELCDRFPKATKYFSLHSAHTGFGAHPASNQIGNGGHFPWG
jgi:hypothetical protein